jgi:hypothetical protein
MPYRMLLKLAGKNTFFLPNSYTAIPEASIFKKQEIQVTA